MGEIRARLAKRRAAAADRDEEDVAAEVPVGEIAQELPAGAGL